jgi:hypothetical protein
MRFRKLPGGHPLFPKRKTWELQYQGTRLKDNYLLYRVSGRCRRRKKKLHKSAWIMVSLNKPGFLYILDKGTISYIAKGTFFIFLSLVTSGICKTILVAAIILSAGSLLKLYASLFSVVL